MDLGFHCMEDFSTSWRYDPLLLVLVRSRSSWNLVSVIGVPLYSSFLLGVTMDMKCPVIVDGKTCGGKLIQQDIDDGKLGAVKVYVCERGHRPLFERAGGNPSSTLESR